MPQKLITSTASADPKPLANVCTNYRTLTLIACKGLDGPTASKNTDTVAVGNSAAASEQPILMAPGEERSFNAAPGKMEDLQKWYLKVASDGDGVVAIYS